MAAFCSDQVPMVELQLGAAVLSGAGLFCTMIPISVQPVSGQEGSQKLVSADWLTWVAFEELKRLGWGVRLHEHLKKPGVQFTRSTGHCRATPRVLNTQSRANSLLLSEKQALKKSYFPICYIYSLYMKLILEVTGFGQQRG